MKEALGSSLGQGYPWSKEQPTLVMLAWKILNRKSLGLKQYTEVAESWTGLRDLNNSMGVSFLV